MGGGSSSSSSSSSSSNSTCIGNLSIYIHIYNSLQLIISLQINVMFAINNKFADTCYIYIYIYVYIYIYITYVSNSVVICIEYVYTICL